MFLNTEIGFTNLYHMVILRIVLSPWNVIFLQRRMNPLHSGCNVRLLQGPQQKAKHELKVKMFTDPFSYRKKKF